MTFLNGRRVPTACEPEVDEVVLRDIPQAGRYTVGERVATEQVSARFPPDACGQRQDMLYLRR